MAAKQTRRHWFGWEVEFLTRHYADYQTDVLAAVLGRPVDRISAKACALGLRKSHELLSEMARERTAAPGHGGAATRFKPGQTPPNKGQKMPAGWAPGKMATTQFKAGNRPHTWVPVGSFRVVEGILEQKFADDPGPAKMRWKAYTRIVWETAHGPIPDGMVVAFLPGRQSVEPAAITADGLELITRTELMARNTLHRYGPEIASIHRLRGAIKRQINRRLEEQR